MNITEFYAKKNPKQTAALICIAGIIYGNIMWYNVCLQMTYFHNVPSGMGFVITFSHVKSPLGNSANMDPTLLFTYFFIFFLYRQDSTLSTLIKIESSIHFKVVPTKFTQ